MLKFVMYLAGMLGLWFAYRMGRAAVQREYADELLSLARQEEAKCDACFDKQVEEMTW